MNMRAVGAMLLLALAGSASCRARTEGLDTATIPDDLRTDYQRFSTKCSKCHSLARPLTSNITDDEQWVMYVNRMRRQPGSGISYEDQAHILRFLKWYAADLRRIAEEKRSGGKPAPSASVPPPVVGPFPNPDLVDGGQ